VSEIRCYYFAEETKEIDIVQQAVDSVIAIPQEDKKTIEIDRLHRQIDSLKAIGN
jgi:tetrahydromethanopterin S-methyltransferase subunit B